MSEQPGTSGLIFNEPLLWDKSRDGRMCHVPAGAMLKTNPAGQQPYR